MLLQNVLQDARFALRQLRNVTGFKLAAMLTRGLGTGDPTVIFSVVQGCATAPAAR
ncbi:MAG TPA: hypothetical protein VMU48_01990 [Terracidiphilus sp.]|nr:hypothetical protein [Terracidiphilus sp.]